MTKYTNMLAAVYALFTTVVIVFAVPGMMTLPIA